MRKSLVNWIRTIALLTAASTGSITFASSRAYAHDLPVFDAHGSIDCFGIGSCRFPIPQGFLEASSSSSEGEAIGDLSSNDAAIFDHCFCEPHIGYADAIANSVDAQPKIETPLPTAISESCIESESMASPKPSFPVDANLSYPASFLSVIQAAGIQIPKLDLLSIEQLIATWELGAKNAVGIEADNFQPSDESYLGKRALVDDYLASESFVRDWRSAQSYRGLNRFDYAVQTEEHEALAIAVPSAIQFDIQSSLSNALAAVEDVQCRFAQELQDFVWTSKLSHFAGWQIGSLACENAGSAGSLFDQLHQNAIDEEMAHSNQLSGMPPFVIQQLDGKDFLLPTNQYQLWNEVPAINANSDVIVESEGKKLPMVQDLAFSISNGLDIIALQLQDIAHNLRIIAQDGSQVANRTSEGVR